MPIPARVAADAQAAEQQLAEMATAVAAARNAPPADDTPPAPPAEPATPAAAPAPAVVPVSNDDLLRRMQSQLDSLQGRYEAQTRRNDQLEQQLQQARAAPPPPAAPATPPPPAPGAFSQEQLDEFGPETLAMVRQLANEQAAPLRAIIDSLQTQLAAVEGRTERIQQETATVAQTQRKTAGQVYIGHLDDSIPGWRAVNDDPAFERWLETADPLSGFKYADLLQNAHSSMDHARVIRIFTAYKPDLANGNPSTTATPAAPKAPTVDPSTLVAPSTTASPSSPPTPPAGRVYTLAEYEKASDDKLKKRITPQQFAEFEAAYMAAVRDGRVSLTS